MAVQKNTQIVLPHHLKGEAVYSSQSPHALSIQLSIPGFALGQRGPIGHTQDSSSFKVTSRSLIFLLKGSCLYEPTEKEPLKNTHAGYLRQGLDSIWNVGEIHALGWRKHTWPFEEFRNYVTNACNHRDSAMLDFSGAAALELFHVTRYCETQRIPKTNRCLNTKFRFKGA